MRLVLAFHDGILKTTLALVEILTDKQRVWRVCSIEFREVGTRRIYAVARQVAGRRRIQNTYRNHTPFWLHLVSKYL